MRLRTEYGWFGALWVLLLVILVFDLSDRFPAFLYVRLVCGLILAAYLPGHYLLTSLFPTKQRLNDLERLVLSVGLSLAIIPGIAMILDTLGLGFRFEVVIPAIGGITAVLAIISLLRRNAVPEQQRFVLTVWPKSNRLALKGASGLAIIAAGLAAVGLIVGVTSMLLPKPATVLTEFSIVDAQGGTANYPKQVVVGQDIDIPFVIHNQEGDFQEYHVEIWVNDQRLATSTPIDLQNSDQVQQSIPFKLSQAGKDQEVVFNLFEGDATTPLRTLHLWFNVTSS